MLRLPLRDCARVTGATLREEDAAVDVAGVGIDTRTLRPGMLYAAIRGERFDGHDFVAAAEQGGASAVLVERDVETTLPRLLVEDVRAALGTLAHHWAQHHQVPIVAVTGSNGKTTVKEIVAAILGQLGPVLATKGNLNNDLGVPLTLFGLAPEHRYAVVEIGANAPGEIAALSAIACPDVGIITNIGPAHLEGFGSLPGVAKAKSELFAALGHDGVAVFDADDAFAGTLRAAASHCRRCEFGTAAGTAVRGAFRRTVDASPAGLSVDVHGERMEADFALEGEHNLRNALAAIAAVRCLDVQMETIAAGLGSVRAVPGRLQRSRGLGGATLIDDTYNANPASVLAALEVLATHAGERHLVLGDMAELGEGARASHAEIGVAAHRLGMRALWTVGPLAEAARIAWRDERAGSDSTVTRSVAGAAAPGDDDVLAPDARRRDDGAHDDGAHDDGAHCDDVETLIRALAPRLDERATVLVKGSRSARMERVVAALRQGGDEPPADESPAPSESAA